MQFILQCDKLTQEKDEDGKPCQSWTGTENRPWHFFGPDWPPAIGASLGRTIAYTLLHQM